MYRTVCTGGAGNAILIGVGSAYPTRTCIKTGGWETANRGSIAGGTVASVAKTGWATTVTVPEVAVLVKVPLVTLHDTVQFPVALKVTVGEAVVALAMEATAVLLTDHE